MRRCVCAVICSFSASVHLPGPQALEVRKSRRPHPVLETVTQGEKAELSGWRREWPQIIPSFPSIPHSHGGCNAKGEIPGEWKVGDTLTEQFILQESQTGLGPQGASAAASEINTNYLSLGNHLCWMWWKSLQLPSSYNLSRGKAWAEIEYRMNNICRIHSLLLNVENIYYIHALYNIYLNYEFTHFHSTSIFCNKL